MTSGSCSRIVVRCRVPDDRADPASPDSAPDVADSSSANGVPIVQTGAPVLRARASELAPQFLGSKQLFSLVDLMIDVMRAAPGVGLAAPQIGVPLRVIVLEERDDILTRAPSPRISPIASSAPFATRVFVNPVLDMPIGDERVTFFEGCLSVNGFAALVERYREVEVSGLDQHGAPQTWRVRGWPARILQHEVDHLDGTLYVDRMITRSFTNSEHAQSVYAGRSIADVRAALGV